MKPAARVAVFVLLLVSLAHLIRVVFGIQMQVGGVPIPLWASALACVVTGGLSFLLWREEGKTWKTIGNVLSGKQR